MPLKQEKAELMDEIERVKYEVDERNLKVQELENDLDVTKKQLLRY
jgi:hypothetical protein